MPKYKISDLSKGMKVYKEQLSEILRTGFLVSHNRELMLYQRVVDNVKGTHLQNSFLFSFLGEAPN